MSYAVFHVAKRQVYKWYPTITAAKRMVTRLNNKAGAQEYHYLDVAAFDEIYNKLVEVKTIHGDVVKIREQDRGTVNDPSTERYWSM